MASDDTAYGTIYRMEIDNGKSWCRFHWCVLTKSIWLFKSNKYRDKETTTMKTKIVCEMSSQQNIAIAWQTRWQQPTSAVAVAVVTITISKTVTQWQRQHNATSENDGIKRIKFTFVYHFEHTRTYTHFSFSLEIIDFYIFFSVRTHICSVSFSFTHFPISQHTTFWFLTLVNKPKYIDVTVCVHYTHTHSA